MLRFHHNPLSGFFNFMDYNKALIRCSALGQVMTDPRGKTDGEKYVDALEELAIEEAKYEQMPNKQLKTAQNKLDKINKLKEYISELSKTKDEVILSETCKSYLIQTYALSRYGRIREVTTKQMVKGTISEEDAIQLFSILDGKLYNKNTDRISNDYICGTPDLYDTDDLFNCNEIIDIKSCWDIFTFLSNVQTPENDAYYWQLQGYMALTGAKIGTIAYCLVNTPESIIEGEKYALLRRMDVVTEEDPDYKRELNLLLANRYFDDIPMQERLLTYSIERNEDDILKIYKKVEKCKEYLLEFEEKHLKFCKHYRKKLFAVA